MRLLGTLVVGLAILVSSAAASAPPRPLEAAVVPTGHGPCGLTTRSSSVWVGVYETGALLRIDERGRIEARLAVGRFACRIAAGARSVWVTRDREGEIVRVALRTGRLRRTKVPAEPFDVLLAARALWVTSHATGVVTRLDPARARPTATVRVGRNPTGLALCGGRIWVGHGQRELRVSSIDPATLRVRRFFVGARPDWPHCIGGVLWLTTPDSVLRLNARTGAVLSRLRIGPTLADAAGGPDGHVWITDKQHSVVHRVARDGRSVVDTFPAGPGAFSLARMRDSMWVTSFAGSDVRRYDP